MDRDFFKKQFTHNARNVGGTVFDVNALSLCIRTWPPVFADPYAVALSQMAHSRRTDMFLKMIDEDAPPVVYTRFAA